MSKDDDKYVWGWWSRDEPEDGFAGFHTKEDLEAFKRGGPGPFRRRLADDGRTVSQLASWADIVMGRDRW